MAGPILLGLHLPEDFPDFYGGHKESGDFPAHRAEHQVQLDVDRSFIYYPYSMASTSSM